MKKRKKPVRLLPKAIKILRDSGWCAGVAERRYGGFSHDYLGFADIVAIKAGHGPAAIQVTTAHNAASHRAKIDSCPGAVRWREERGRVELWLFHKRGARWLLDREIVVGPLRHPSWRCVGSDVALRIGAGDDYSWVG